MPTHALHEQVEAFKITKWTGFGAEAAKETGSKVVEGIVSNTETGLIQVRIPANVGITKISNIQLSIEGGNSALTAPRATVENRNGLSFTIRVVRSKQVVIDFTKMNKGVFTLDPVEQCTDVAVKIFVRVAGT